MATLHQLHPQSPPIAGFLRVGHTGHRKLLELNAAGRFPYRRVVFDAAHCIRQKDLAKALKAAGCEIVLDPNFAEMSAVGRFRSSAIQKLKWANAEREWQFSDFRRRRNHDVAKAIAEFSVEFGADVVLAPTHLIEKIDEPWRSVDLEMCGALRYELDRAGGSHISIDYQLITTINLLKEAKFRLETLNTVSDLPVENLWLRVSGFGSTSTGVGTTQIIELVRDLHGLKRPIIADMTGGFAGLAVTAFGAFSGICHGVGLEEIFRAGDWKKTSDSGSGSATRIYVQELDRYFKKEQLNSIFQAKGGLARFGCVDTACCPRGAEDMMENSHAHFITQRHRQIDDLSAVPDERRAQEYLLRHLDPAVRGARRAILLKVDDEDVSRLLKGARSRLIRLRDALGHFYEVSERGTRSPSPTFRGGVGSSKMIVRR